ncbi:MAG TPA: GTP-binding protein, partial [Coleofasciculaceae cyanobacterium]
MPLPRLLTLIIGISLILVLMLWLINSLSELIWQASLLSPWLANLLLALVIVLLGLLIGVLIYYLWIFGRAQQRPRRRRRPPQVPEQKTEAARENLKAVRYQVRHIQDEVARQALESRSREIEAILSRGELQVVVFGTGSAGKTSLVNALIGRMVGQVGAPMGTTQTGET